MNIANDVFNQCLQQILISSTAGKIYATGCFHRLQIPLIIKTNAWSAILDCSNSIILKNHWFSRHRPAKNLSYRTWAHKVVLFLLNLMKPAEGNQSNARWCLFPRNINSTYVAAFLLKALSTVSIGSDNIEDTTCISPETITSLQKCIASPSETYSSISIEILWILWLR